MPYDFRGFTNGEVNCGFTAQSLTDYWGFLIDLLERSKRNLNCKSCEFFYLIIYNL